MVPGFSFGQGSATCRSCHPGHQLVGEPGSITPLCMAQVQHGPRVKPGVTAEVKWDTRDWGVSVDEAELLFIQHADDGCQIMAAFQDCARRGDDLIGALFASKLGVLFNPVERDLA